MSESWNKRDVGPGSSRFFQKPPSFGSGFEFDLSFPLEKPAIKIIDETKQGHVVDSENLAKSDPSKLAVQFETEIQEIHVEEPGSTTELLQQKVPAEFVNTFSQHKQHEILNYKDFMPLPRDQHPPETLIRRERFPDLVIRANKWLLENKEYSAAFCQTISHFELPKHKKHKHKSDSTIVKIGNSFGHTHGLRIWLKKNESGFPQRLQYFDTVPRAYESFASHSKQRGVQTYESIDRVVERINDVLRITSLPGRIITAETVTTPHPDDPELCHFWERKDIQDTQYVHFLRIFLEEAAPRRVMIAITDFPPKILDFTVMGLTLNRGRQYESLYSVLQRADTWLRQQVSLNVVTVQTIPQREEFYGTDETETFFVEPALASVDILRILRVAYVRELDDFRDEITENRATSFSGSLSLSCKIFAPEKQSLAEETRDAQIRRVLNWLDTNEDVSQLLWLETGLFKRHEEWRMAEILHKGDVVYKDKSTDYWDTHYRFCIRAFYIGPRKKTTTEQKLYLSRINANAFGFGKCSVS